MDALSEILRTVQLSGAVYLNAEFRDPRCVIAHADGELCIDSDPEHRQGWLNALRDRYVGRAMLRLHADPARAWTVDELAHDVGLSRSALAQRFSELPGQPPMQYLAHWRLQMAARELRDGSKSLSEVAITFGYESEPAFSCALKREFGSPPASWRNSQREGGAASAVVSN